MNMSVLWNTPFFILLLVVKISIDYCVGKDKNCNVKKFRLVYRDFVLSGNVLAAHKVKDVAICMLHCHYNDKCQSYNYQYHGEEENLCEINNITLSACPGERLQKKGFVYYENVNDLLINNKTYGSKCNPGKSCDYLQEHVQGKSGEYWIMYNSQTLKVYCTYDNVTFNLALKKPTQQSSNYGYGYTSNKAVDGNKNTYILSGTCTHTRGEDSPWLRIDLEALYYIRRVDLTNRGDCCGDRISGFQIRIGISLDDNGNANPACGGKHTLGQGETRAFACTPPLLGEYVNIVIPGKIAILSVCEVEVYA